MTTVSKITERTGQVPASIEKRPNGFAKKSPLNTGGIARLPRRDLDDETFIEVVKNKIKEKGISSWNRLISECVGFKVEIFKRELPREEFGF